jgi:predicted ATP-grasp superfamily ATP-dependent carboligase
MSPPGRPKGEYRSAQHEGTPVSRPLAEGAATPPRMAIIGRLGTPQLACLRSWRRAGVPCVFLHAAEASLPRAVQRLLGVPCVHLGPLRLDDDAFVARLSQALSEHGVQALTCVSEPIGVALWACRDRLPAGLQIAAAKPAAVQRLESKASQDGLAREAGLQCLPSWLFGPGDRVDNVPATAFPLAVRPDVARRVEPAFKVAVVASAAELQRIVDGLAPQSSAVIAQPLVRGPNLLVHAWRSTDGRCAGHLAFRVEVKHRGLTVVMRPVSLDPHIERGCARIEQRLGLSGVFHYEFIEDSRSGQAWFLDLNPRLGGTTGKALSAGYDEPLALVATLTPGGLTGKPFVGLLRASGGKHQALRALVSTLLGHSTQADYPYPDRRRTLRALLAFLFGGRDELLRLNALPSLLGFALYQVSRRVGA